MTDTKICPQCASSVTARAHFCLQCGFQLDKIHEPQDLEPVSDPISEPILGSADLEDSNSSPEVSGAQAAHLDKLVDLVLIRSPDLPSVRLKVQDQAQIGRNQGHMVFKDDHYISPHHATLIYRDHKLYLRDESSFNGVYIRMTDPVELEPNEIFIAGEQMCLVEDHPQDSSIIRSDLDQETRFFANMKSPALVKRLAQVLDGGQRGICFPFLESSISIGRQDCDLNFPQDRFMSSRHCHVSLQGDRVVLTDMGSRNGTFVRIKGETAIALGDFILVGKQLLQVQPHQVGSQAQVNV